MTEIVFFFAAAAAAAKSRHAQTPGEARERDGQAWKYLCFAWLAMIPVLVVRYFF